jgi:hypothetical protein
MAPESLVDDARIGGAPTRARIGAAFACAHIAGAPSTAR